MTSLPEAAVHGHLLAKYIEQITYFGVVPALYPKHRIGEFNISHAFWG